MTIDKILPQKIIKAENCKNERILLENNNDITLFSQQKYCEIKAKGYIIIDFAKEYQGGINIFSLKMDNKRQAKVRIRFGESVMECCSDLGYKNSTNDHSIRDDVVLIPWCGELDYGMTGFRFCRIDNVDDVTICISQIFCSYKHSGKKILGNFRCDDEVVNSVWDASVRTIYLNNNDYITDGIKRDRVVWVGDLYPETLSVLNLMGNDKSLLKSLDLLMANTKLPDWINGIPSYSLWWLINLYEIYLYEGNITIFTDRLKYIEDLTSLVISVVKDNGELDFGNFKSNMLYFIDWRSYGDEYAQKLGFYSLLIMFLQRASKIFKLLGIDKFDNSIKRVINSIKSLNLTASKNKQMSSLAVCAGLLDSLNVDRDILSKDGLKGLSTFLGCFVMNVRAMHDVNNALEILKNYYGGMLKVGSTTLWEDFDVAWLNGAKCIDELLKDNEYDIHGDNGAYCFEGYRNSMCHGWASGSISFLINKIVGLKIIEPGFKKIEINPNLGYLNWVKCDIPTPYGLIYVDCAKDNGVINVNCSAPDGVEVIIKK